MTCHQTGYDSPISTITFAVACTGLPRDATASFRDGQHTCREQRSDPTRTRLFRMAFQIMPYRLGHTRCSYSRRWVGGSTERQDGSGLERVFTALRDIASFCARACRTESRRCRLPCWPHALHIPEVRKGRVAAWTSRESDASYRPRSFAGARDFTGGSGSGRCPRSSKPLTRSKHSHPFIAAPKLPSPGLFVAKRCVIGRRHELDHLPRSRGRERRSRAGVGPPCIGGQLP